MRRTKRAERFNPENYGMIFCPGCSGSGSSFANAQWVNVCEVCGGFGFIKKKNKNSFKYDRVIAQLLK